MRRALVLCFVFGCAPRSGHPNGHAPKSDVDGGRPALATMHAHPSPCSRSSEDVTGCILDCDRGIAFACSELATRFELSLGVPPDPTRAASLHERACELKEHASCSSLARMYASGRGVPPSRARQLDFLERACRSGDPLACAVPARAFATGNGVPRDERRAKALYEQACLGGVETACDTIDDAGRN